MMTGSGSILDSLSLSSAKRGVATGNQKVPKTMTFLACLGRSLSSVFRRKQIKPSTSADAMTSAAGGPGRRVSRQLSTDLPPFPLSQRDMFTVVRTWKSVQSEIVDTGMRMFLRMFETNPTVKKTFEKFRQLGTPSELWKSSVLETHGMVVMHAIDEIISCFEDEEEVVDLILEQGRSHARFGDDLNEQIFWAIEEPFLLAVKETLDDRYTRRVELLYKKTIKYILTVIVIGYRQTKRSSNQTTSVAVAAAVAAGALADSKNNWTRRLSAVAFT